MFRQQISFPLVDAINSLFPQNDFSYFFIFSFMKSEAHGNEYELQNTHCILCSRDLKGRIQGFQNTH